MPELPSGTVSFLFTDIEGSTRRWEQRPVAMRAAVERHFALLREAITSHGGHVFRLQGDGLCAAFATAPQALVQRMTLGSGAQHSERNHSQTEAMQFLQLWILPDRRGLKPEIAQRQHTLDERHDRLLRMVRPMDTEGTGVTVHQDTSIHVARLDPGVSVEHLINEDRGGYFYLIEGDVELNNERLATGMPPLSLATVCSECRPAAPVSCCSSTHHFDPRASHIERSSFSTPPTRPVSGARCPLVQLGTDSLSLVAPLALAGLESVPAATPPTRSGTPAHSTHGWPLRPRRGCGRRSSTT